MAPQIAVAAGAAVAGALANRFLGNGNNNKDKSSKEDTVFPVDAHQNYDHEKDIQKYIHLAQEWPEVSGMGRSMMGDSADRPTSPI